MAKYYPKMTGERCYLSPVNPDEVDLFTKWLNDLEVTRFLTLAGYSISSGSERDALDRLSKEHNYTIVLKDEDLPIGNCGFIDISHINRTAECGIFIGEKDLWGKGYGTEAMNLLLEYGFNYLNLNNIMLRVFSNNPRAAASYKKSGFKEIGIRRNSLYREGQWWDEIFMDILVDEFEQNP